MGPVPAEFVWSITPKAPDAMDATLQELPATVFEGHYPGAPVLPGALLVDAVRQAAEQWQRRPMLLSSLASARYYAPVFPGDHVSLAMQLAGQGGSEVQASISTARGPAAVIKAALSIAEETPSLPAPRPEGSPSHLDQTAIRRLLPHRHPMLLIDRASVFETSAGVRLIACKAVTANEPCFARAPQDQQDWRYPEVFVMESFCQGCGVLRASVGRAPDDDRVPVLARIVRFRFLRPVLPGSVLVHHVHIEASTADGAVFGGGTWVDGQQVASVDRIVAALAPKF